MVSDEALKKLQEQIEAWPMTQRFVVQQLIRDYLRNREDLRAYKATGLTPERCAEFARADAEGRYIVMRDAEQEGVARLRELAEADRDGRVVVLPFARGRTLLCKENIDSLRLMKDVEIAIRYCSSCGIVFHMDYNVFCDLVKHGRITAVSDETEKALEEMKDE